MAKIDMTNHVKVRRNGQEIAKPTPIVPQERPETNELADFETNVKKELQKFKDSQKQQTSECPNRLLRRMMSELDAQRA